MKKILGVIILVLVFSSCVLANGYEVANGGFELSLIKLDLGGLDTVLAKDGYSINDLAIMYGGGGMSGLKTGDRFGGCGGGGEIIDENAAGDQAVLGFGFGGFVYERGVYMNGNTDIAVGSMIGGGGAELKLYNKTDDSYKKYAKGFIAFQPRLNIHHQITERIGIELNAGYLFTYDFNQDWTINNETINGPFRYFGGPRVGVRFVFGF